MSVESEESDTTKKAENSLQNAEDATFEYLKRSQAANDDGTYDAEVVNWVRDAEEDIVKVDFHIPTYGRKTEWMDWGEPTDDEKSKFERLVNSKGLSMEEADRLIGMKLKAKKMDSDNDEDGEWILKEGEMDYYGLPTQLRHFRRVGLSEIFNDQLERLRIKYKFRLAIEAFATLTIGFGAALATIGGLAIYSNLNGESEVFKCLSDDKIAALVISSLIVRIVSLFGLGILYL